MRNAIVHQRDGEGHVIAQPTDEVVEEIEGILELLVKEPPVSDYFLKKITVCKEGDSVLETQKIMEDKGYSKLPVVRNREVVGLLYIEDIASWACGVLRNERGMDTVGKVMVDIYKRSSVVFISKNTSVYEIPPTFTRGLKKGKKIDAIFITETGSKKEKIIGVITAKDLPQILECF